jgi:hypothetical protein
MGNALKIRKYQGGEVVDEGFPNDGSTDNGYDGNQPGIVGGIDEDSDQIQCAASILVKGNGTITADTGSSTVTGTGTNFDTDEFNSNDSQIWVSNGAGGYTSVGIYDSTSDDEELSLGDPANVNVTDSEWYYTIVTGSASIVRQKGSRTFLVVANNNSIQDESIAAGQAYMINSVSNTDWAALGADPTAARYDIFTAKVSGHGLTTNGTVWAVGTCILVDDSNPDGINQMSVEIYDDGDTYYASRLKNKFSTNFATPYANCNPGYTYSATFFNDNGDTLPSPSAPGDLVYTLAGTENWC